MDEIKQDRRKNNIGDRIKHIVHHIDVIEKQHTVVIMEQECIDKEWMLLKGDLHNLIQDIYGIERTNGVKNDNTT